ncbi:hypothetical protein LX16_4672 [Stackebrandtia albiflava]|uniref:Uncharacterized protein n=1 Tax=Stackebrandtia albiflava TaxID=406432 RepID=A0A562UQJ8_9ACTN|nr:hypothetical protein [Stackebrandtia albiflava]TWJ07890.1 hypothetical protein LX16_4672 [Stackebrandtia albiflava]
MEWMRRHSRGIALIALIAMATPFAAQLVGRLTALDPLLVAALLFIVVAVAIAGTVVRRKDRDDD